MRIRSIVLAAGTLAVCGFIASSIYSDERDGRVYVYRDGDSEDNHGYWTNRMPDPAEYKGADEMLDVGQVHKKDPHSGKTCIRMELKKWVAPYWTGVAVACEPNYWSK